MSTWINWITVWKHLEYSSFKRSCVRDLQFCTLSNDTASCVYDSVESPSQSHHCAFVCYEKITYLYELERRSAFMLPRLRKDKLLSSFWSICSRKIKFMILIPFMFQTENQNIGNYTNLWTGNTSRCDSATLPLPYFKEKWDERLLLTDAIYILSSMCC